MGKFNVSMRVGDLAKSSLAEVEALADTGSIHSYIPRDALDEVNVLPIKTRPFALADERVVEMEFGCATFVLQSMEVIAPAIFAEEGSSPILGVSHLGGGALRYWFRKRRIDTRVALGVVRQRQPERFALSRHC